MNEKSKMNETWFNRGQIVRTWKALHHYAKSAMTKTATWLVHLDKGRCAEQEAAGSNTGLNNTQGLLKTEEKVLPL